MRARKLAKALDRKSLDEVEGERTNYLRADIDVSVDGSRKSIRAITYLARALRAGIQTSQKYVEFILVGLTECDAQRDYVAYVKRVALANNPELRLLA